jgi:hypothetical protein
MAPVEALTRLVDAVRAAGGGFTRRGDVLWVRWGTLDRDDQDALTPLIRRWKPDLLALLDAETALAVFPGARVVACSICGSTRWRPVGDREVCVVCRPAPGRTSSSPRTESPRRPKRLRDYRDRPAGAHRTRPRGDAEWLSRRRT